MKKILQAKNRNVIALLLCVFFLGGCGQKAEPVVNIESFASPEAYRDQSGDGQSGDAGQEGSLQEGGNDLETAQTEPEKLEPPVPERPKVKGIFVTGAMAGTDNMDYLIDLVDQTELNAMVIDVKNDEGWITYKMDTPLVEEFGASKRYIRDIKALVEKCKEKDIYLIARIVAFKDPYLAQVKPEWCVHNADGSLFKDKSGLAWLDPYQRPVWGYLMEISKEALAMGFDEIQFDYVRFSTDSGMENVDFGQDNAEKDRREIITEFIRYAAENIHAAGGAVSADVYGVVIDSEKDQKIVGQDYKELSRYLDYISPMVYPSHYGPYNYNIPVPDAEPYRLVLTAMQSSRKVLAGISAGTVSGNDLSETEVIGAVGDVAKDVLYGAVGDAAKGALQGAVVDVGKSVLQDAAEDMGKSALQETTGDTEGDMVIGDGMEEYSMEELAALQPEKGIKVQVRPWLQDFTATWVKGHIPYGPDEIRAQIQAVYDAGYEEWILWNASNRYTEEGLLKER